MLGPMLWNIYFMDCTSSLLFWALKLSYNLSWSFCVFGGSRFLRTQFIQDYSQKRLFLLHFTLLKTWRDQLTESWCLKFLLCSIGLWTYIKVVGMLFGYLLFFSVFGGQELSHLQFFSGLSLVLFVLPHNCFRYWGFFLFYINFKTVFSIFMNNYIFI